MYSQCELYFHMSSIAGHGSSCPEAFCKKEVSKSFAQNSQWSAGAGVSF